MTPDAHPPPQCIYGSCRKKATINGYCQKHAAIMAKRIPHVSLAPEQCPYWHPEKNLYLNEPDNHCTMQFSAIKEQAARKATLAMLDKVVQIIETEYPMMQNLKQRVKSLRVGDEPR